MVLFYFSVAFTTFIDLAEADFPIFFLVLWAIIFPIPIVTIILLLFIQERRRLQKLRHSLREKIGTNERIYETSPEEWILLRKDVLKRDGYCCSQCKSKSTLHVHHIKPLSQGGTNDLSNLTTLCKRCHTKIHPFME